MYLVKVVSFMSHKILGFETKTKIITHGYTDHIQLRQGYVGQAD